MMQPLEVLSRPGPAHSDAWDELRARLLAIGGDAVWPWVDARFLERLLRDGRQWSLEGMTVVHGWPFACLANAVPRWINGEGDLARGYALKDDGSWWINHFIVRPDGTILDSLSGHVAYYGIILNAAELEIVTRHLVDRYGRLLTHQNRQPDKSSEGS